MGIYIHVPFCRSRCFYCGFYSVASLQQQDAYTDALLREMELRKDYLPAGRASTLYLGGGTPSCLSAASLARIMEGVRSFRELEEGAECSIEMNPEDATDARLEELVALGFNRLTLGVQSFRDDVLRRINRRHTAADAVRAVERAARAGFGNVGIDLILGLPGMETADLEREFEVVRRLEIAHISVYILSIDSRSVYQKLSERGKFSLQDDDLMADQYLLTAARLRDMGFEHYEISNFARDGKYSRHNTSYWQQVPYIGLGPSAHSYDIVSRQWNPSSLKAYIGQLEHGGLEFEREVLSSRDRFNEYLMTRLRTVWGIGRTYVRNTWPGRWERLAGQLERYAGAGLLVEEGDRVHMTERGWLVSDAVFSELFA